MKFWTYSLTSGSLTLDAVDGATFISIQCDATAGNCSVLGGIDFKGIAPNAVTLAANQGINFAAASSFSPLDGITITWLGGIVDIIVGF
jgi:hypothetical protein